MVKGVNKTVIVVNDTGSEMFEKIVFYVTPKYSKVNLKQLQSAAGEVSSRYITEKRRCRSSLRKQYALRRAAVILAILAALAGIATTVIALLF